MDNYQVLKYIVQFLSKVSNVHSSVVTAGSFNRRIVQLEYVPILFLGYGPMRPK